MSWLSSIRSWIHPWVVFCGGLLFLLALGFALSAMAQPSKAWFEIQVSETFKGRLPETGRLFVISSRKAGQEPRFGVGWAGPEAEPFFARDIVGWDGTRALLFGEKVVGFLVDKPGDLKPGRYFAQPLYDVDTTFSYINAPGNFYGPPVPIDIGTGKEQHFRLLIDHQIPPETLPEDTGYVKHVRIQSRLLSAFWGKPMYLRAAVILPRGYDAEPERRYPVRYHISGYHARYTRALRMMAKDSKFRATWLSDGCPRMLYVHLDGEAPFGDSYQTNSANNGPYGDATVQELIPYIESRFRAIGTAEARFVEGGSTGGWASLALQIFYPDFFNGVWSFCADGVDFHHFQLVDVYEDTNAFVNEYGYERPSMRDPDGEPRFSIRREVSMERTLGRGNTFATSGGQWGGWNAVYSPRGPNGWPLEIWDSWTGTINPEVAAHWKAYDLRLILVQNWSTLGLKLQGKLNIWMGDMDSFYLNNAMRKLEAFLQQTENPKSDARIIFAPGKKHCWRGISEIDMMREMVARMTAQDRQ